MARLIDADILVEHLRDQRLKQTGVYTTGFNNATNIAISLARNPDACPAIDAKPVVHGEWIMRGGRRYCSACERMACVTRDSEDFWYTLDTNFCPNCGADMRGET